MRTLQAHERQWIARLGQLKNTAHFNNRTRILVTQEREDYELLKSLFSDEFLQRCAYKQTGVACLMYADSLLNLSADSFDEIGRLAECMKAPFFQDNKDGQKIEQTLISSSDIKIRTALAVSRIHNIRLQQGITTQDTQILFADPTLNSFLLVHDDPLFVDGSKLKVLQHIEYQYIGRGRPSKAVIPVQEVDLLSYELVIRIDLEILTDKEGKLKDILVRPKLVDVTYSRKISKRPASERVFEILKDRPELLGLVYGGEYIPITLSHRSIKDTIRMLLETIAKSSHPLASRVTSTMPNNIPIMVPCFVLPGKVFIDVDGCPKQMKQLKSDVISIESGTFRRRKMFLPVYVLGEGDSSSRSIGDAQFNCPLDDEYLADPDTLSDVRVLASPEEYVTSEELLKHGVSLERCLQASRIAKIRCRLPELRSRKITEAEVVDFLNSRRWQGPGKFVEDLAHGECPTVTMILLSRACLKYGAEFDIEQLRKVSPGFGEESLKAHVDEGIINGLLLELGESRYRILKLDRVEVPSIDGADGDAGTTQQRLGSASK